MGTVENHQNRVPSLWFALPPTTPHPPPLSSFSHITIPPPRTFFLPCGPVSRASGGARTQRWARSLRRARWRLRRAPRLARRAARRATLPPRRTRACSRCCARWRRRGGRGRGGVPVGCGGFARGLLRTPLPLKYTRVAKRVCVWGGGGQRRAMCAAIAPPEARWLARNGLRARVPPVSPLGRGTADCRFRGIRSHCPSRGSLRAIDMRLATLVRNISPGVFILSPQRLSVSEAPPTQQKESKISKYKKKYVATDLRCVVGSNDHVEISTKKCFHSKQALMSPHQT